MDEKDLAKLFEREQKPDTSPGNIPMPGVPVQVISVMEAEEPGEKRTKDSLDDYEIESIIDARIKDSVAWVGSEISNAQAKAMQYYLGQPEGDLAPPGVMGRSSIVDTTVSDQVEWMMPALMEIFLASGNVIKYGPRRPGQEDGAKQMTDLVNHIIMEDNPGFLFFMDWFKNSLLCKVGVAKVYWEEFTDITHEQYDGIDDVQLGILADDPSLHITKIVSYVDPAAERAAMDQFDQQMKAVQAWDDAAQMAQSQGLPWPPMQPAPPSPGGPGKPPMAPPTAPGGSMGGPGMPPAPPQMVPMQPPPKPKPIDVTKLPQLHNVTITMSDKSGKICVESMNSEDFLISKRSRRIGDGFSAHRVRKTLSDLRATYGDKVDDIDIDQIESDPNSAMVENSSITYARESLQSAFKTGEYDDYGDESQRNVWYFECYLPIDVDGDGIAEWRKIVRAGNVILENEIVDGPPFAALCPIPIPGLFYGRSVADLAMPMQLAKTGVIRSLVDNMNVQINGRTWAIENQVNLTDLLTNRPGGVVRVKSANAVGQLQQGMADSVGAYKLLEFLDAAGQERSGITKYTQGTDGDMLNPTATAYKGITQRSDMRVKLIARLFGEGGVKDLCTLVQKTLMRYQDKKMTFQLEGKWVDVDPRVWKNKYTMKCTVGLGTGDQSAIIQQIMALLGVQQQAVATGMVTLPNLYQSFSDLVRAMQRGDPSNYFTPPQPGQQMPSPPDPQMEAVKSTAALQQQKQQYDQQRDAQKAQNDKENDIRQSNLQMQQTLLREELLDKREREQFLMKHQWEQQQFEQNQKWEREKFYTQMAVQTNQAAMKAGVDAQTAATGDQIILQDLESGQSVQMPVDSLHAIRDQNFEAQQADLDRTHEAEQNKLDREAEQQNQREQREHEAKMSRQNPPKNDGG